MKKIIGSSIGDVSVLSTSEISPLVNKTVFDSRKKFNKQVIDFSYVRAYSYPCSESSMINGSYLKSKLKLPSWMEDDDQQ